MPCLEPGELDSAGLQIIEADPLIEEHTDALYVPFAGYGLDDDRSWGLYARDGRLIPAAAYVRGPGRALVGQSGHASVGAAEIEDAPDEHLIHAGPLLLHYGHFLLSTLSRLWPLAGGLVPRSPLLWHSNYDLAVLPGHPYVGAALSGLGLDAGAFRRFTRPTRIRRLTVIAPAFIEESLAHRAYARLCRTVGDRLAPGLAAGPSAPAYLARSRLGGGVKGIANEDALCRALASLGVEIVHPEQLSLAGQVRLFGTDRVVMGLCGSAFHTAAFAPPRARLVMIEVLHGRNQHLVNRLSGCRMQVLRPSEPLPFIEGGTFERTYAFPDPAAAARDLLRHAQAMR